MKKNQTFEQAMARLGEIVAVLEGQDTPLDASLKLFGEGADLLSFCDKALKDAQLKIEKLFPEGSGQNGESHE